MARITVTPIRPYVDGYSASDKMFYLLVEPYDYGAWFSSSKKTLHILQDDITLDAFRKVGKDWICWGSGSKQKWAVKIS